MLLHSIKYRIKIFMVLNGVSVMQCIFIGNMTSSKSRTGQNRKQCYWTTGLIIFNYSFIFKCSKVFQSKNCMLLCQYFPYTTLAIMWTLITATFLLNWVFIPQNKMFTQKTKWQWNISKTVDLVIFYFYKCHKYICLAINRLQQFHYEIQP